MTWNQHDKKYNNGAFLKMENLFDTCYEEFNHSTDINVFMRSA